MKVIPDAMRRPAEIERDELRRRLAEIEEREAACCPEDVPFDEYIRALGGQLARARAEIERKNRLIEQMRAALKIAAPCVKEIFGYHSKDYVEIKAALSAAERGE